MKSYISRKLPLATRNTVLIFCRRSAGDSILHSPALATRCRLALPGAYLATVLGLCSPHVVYGGARRHPSFAVHCGSASKALLTPLRRPTGRSARTWRHPRCCREMPWGERWHAIGKVVGADGQGDLAVLVEARG